MKMINKSIEVIAYFKGSYPIPLRFRFYDESSGNVVIKVDQILFVEEGNALVNKMITYKCQSVIGNMGKVFELKYETYTGKWFLYRM